MDFEGVSLLSYASRECEPIAASDSESPILNRDSSRSCSTVSLALFYLGLLMMESRRNEEGKMRRLWLFRLARRSSGRYLICNTKLSCALLRSVALACRNAIIIADKPLH